MEPILYGWPSEMTETCKNDLLKILWEYPSMYVAIIDTKGTCVFINPTLKTAFQLTNEATAVNFCNLLKPDTGKDEHCTNCLLEPAKHHRVLLLMNLEGSNNEIQWDFHPLKNGGDQLICVTGYPVSHDVIPLNVLQQIDFHRDMLEQTNNLARVGGWEYSIASGQIICTDIAREIYGFSGHLEGLTLQVLLTCYKAGKSRTLMAAAFQNAMLQAEPFDLELQIITPNSQEKWVRTIGKAVFADNVCIRLYGALLDIEHKIRAQNELEVSEQRWAFALEGSGDGVWDWDMVSDQVFFSKQWKMMLGYQVEDLDNTLEEWRLRVHPDDIEKCYVDIQKHLSGSTLVYENEHRMLCKNGGYKWVLARGKVMDWDSDGKPTRLIGTHTDIDHIKLIESELLQAKEMAEAGSRAKSEFLANMSHEIRTPLNGVIGFTDLLMKTNLDSVQHQYMETVHQSANSLLDIINDILDFSKIEAGKLELSHEKTDLIELAGKVADIVKYQAHVKDLEMLLNLSPEIDSYVHADPVRLRQVLVNLLGNAIKFTQVGEIELKIEVLRKEQASALFRFSVRDTGPGISHNNQVRIFEAFSQEDSSITRKYGGTGLGLTISNKLLALMGSYMQLESVVGVGSTFWFDVEFKTSKGKSVQWNHLDQFRRILIIDDNQNNRRLLKEMLETQSISSVLADSGKAAIALLQAGEQFDAVLVDYQMPEMDGLETVKIIRNELGSITKNIPVLLLSSSSDDENTIITWKSLDIKQWMVKPVKMIQLFEALSNIHIVKKEEDVSVQGLPPIHQIDINQLQIKVLIIEDNAVNMFLAKAILGKILPKATLKEATDGKAGVYIYSKELPEIVFMDVQMPIMNGYEATAAIRKIENGKSRVPIIALTAGTVLGEREKCLDADMDDYISKPIIKDEVETVLRKWLFK